MAIGALANTSKYGVVGSMWGRYTRKMEVEDYSVAYTIIKMALKRSMKVRID